MSAMRKELEILSVEEKTSKKGTKYFVCQCIVHHGEDMKVGELSVFQKGITPAKGKFMAEFDIRVDFERRVGAELIALTPVGRPAATGMAPRPAV